MDLILCSAQLHRALQLSGRKLVFMLLEVNQPQPVPQFPIVWPARRGSLTNFFSFRQPACLKITEQEPAVHVLAVRRDVRSFFKSTRSAVEILSANGIFAL